MSLKHDLSRPEAYPLQAPRRVELIETHLSWVFRLERDVFKVKKAVNLGFVDFRTLAQRKAACQAEVALNERLAPGVYLGMVPIVRGPRGLVVGGPGEPVEWAVHMRRLRDERRADILLARGALSGEQVDALAERIAAFHATARCDAEITRFGSVELIRRNVFENFTQTAGSVLAVMSEREAEEIATYQTWFLATHEALLEERMAQRRVRDTHGDLRLEHAYLSNGGSWTVIDCIEFNERFRYADVCSEVAFLSMDLALNGRPDLAERFLARYARASGDFDLYALVDFYESYRAFVRGKVALLLAADPGVDGDAREHARSAARRHFLFALAAGRPPLVTPFMLAVGGLVASGKSTLAERLSEQVGAPVVSSDLTRKQLFGAAPEQVLGRAAFAGAYAPEQSERVYAEVVRRARVVLASGRPVILDASFRSAHDREVARRIAREQNVPFLFAECTCSPELSRARLEARTQSPGVSDARPELQELFAQRFEAVQELSGAEHVVLDTEQPLDDNSAAILGRLGLRVEQAEANRLAART